MDDETLMRNRKDARKTLAWGLVWVVGAAWVVFYGLGNPINDLRLMLYAETAAGEIIDAAEDAQDGDDGRLQWSHAAVYRFRTRDGRVVHGTSKGVGRLRDDLVNLQAPVPVDVEYHPHRPSLNRLKGDGSQTLAGWLIRTSGFVLLLAMVCWPGVQMLRHGLAQHHQTID